MLGGLAVALATLSEISVSIEGVSARATPSAVVQALAILASEGHPAWTVGELVARVHVGPAHTTRLFTDTSERRP